MIPTKDARIAEVFGHLTKIHPGVICLVDGDPAGQRYCAELCALAPAPQTIIRWPAGWRIEDLIGWIIAVDPGMLVDHELAAAGIPEDQARLVAALLGPLKTNEIAHALLADAIAKSDRSRARVQHVLKVLGAIAAERPAQPAWTAVEDHANGATKIWTFNDAVPGL